MTVRFCWRVAVVSFSAALNGCVSVGGADALITPVGVAGIHSFKPTDSARDIRLPAQKNPDRVAANQQRPQAAQKDEI